jgi:hypothetical protein
MNDADQLRGRLGALRATLTNAWGARVADVDLDALPDDVVAGLCDHEAHRIRALIEGTAAGWTPGWRTTRATPAAPVGPAAAPGRGSSAGAGEPVRVRFHRGLRGRVVA